jgi:hypothetical protein
MVVNKPIGDNARKGVAAATVFHRGASHAPELRCTLGLPKRTTRVRVDRLKREQPSNKRY